MLCEEKSGNPGVKRKKKPVKPVHIFVSQKISTDSELASTKKKKKKKEKIFRRAKRKEDGREEEKFLSTRKKRFFGISDRLFCLPRNKIKY
jgi:hypothetical protein